MFGDKAIEVVLVGGDEIVKVPSLLFFIPVFIELFQLVITLLISNKFFPLLVACVLLPSIVIFLNGKDIFVSKLMFEPLSL